MHRIPWGIAGEFILKRKYQSYAIF